jgi:hypothetical protein
MNVRTLVLAALAAAIATPALAQYPNPYPSTGYVKFQSGSGVGAYGTQVGPYKAVFSFGLITGPFGMQADVFCVDKLNYATTQATKYNFTRLSSPTLTGKTRMGEGGRLQYLQAAYLSSKFATATPSGDPTPGSPSYRNIHGAIWYIMGGWVPMDAGIQSYVIEAQTNCTGNANCGNVNLGDWYVLTDQSGVGVRRGGAQEYLTHQVVPEPATLLLLGTGLLVTLAAAGVLRRPSA